VFVAVTDSTAGRYLIVDLHRSDGGASVVAVTPYPAVANDIVAALNGEARHTTVTELAARRARVRLELPDEPRYAGSDIRGGAVDLSNAITMDPHEARQHADELEIFRNELTPEEEAFLDGYRALASGRPILNLHDTIRAGGEVRESREYWSTDFVMPRLAVAPAGDKVVHCTVNNAGAVHFEKPSGRGWELHLPRLTLPANNYNSGSAMVPTVPVGTRVRLRKRGQGGWRGCLILFEVDRWTPLEPPGDPALLRHIGGFLYTVEATWDLTDLERAVLAGGRVT
jgi:hypothetical protein